MSTAPPNDGAITPSSRPVVLAHFVWALIGVGLMLGAWSLATPLGAAPDEPEHTTQAAAVVRGQFDEPTSHFPGGRIAWVRVPCWVDSAWLRVTCSHAGTGAAPTQFSNAPPLYYVVVGVPSLLFSGTRVPYIMRATGDVLNAGLCALGIFLLLRHFPRRTSLIGILLALSPMVFFLMAVLNSSGFEIAAAFATWCGGLCVAVQSPTVPRSLAIWTALAGTLLILSRPTSPLDALVIGLVLAVFVGWRQLRVKLNRTLNPLWIPLVVALLIAGVFLLIGGPPSLLGVRAPHPASLASNMAKTLRLTGGYLEQSIGNFGLLDIAVPTWITIVWIACLSALTAAALFLSHSCRRALPVLAIAILALPLALQAPQLNSVGPYFQGRYMLPILVGFPLVASAMEWQGRYVVPRRLLTRVVFVLGVVVFAAQVTAFNRGLAFYKGGNGHLAGVPAGWVPPIGELGVNVMFVGGALILLSLFVVMSRDSEDPASSFIARRPE